VECQADHDGFVVHVPLQNWADVGTPLQHRASASLVHSRRSLRTEPDLDQQDAVSPICLIRVCRRSPAAGVAASSGLSVSASRDEEFLPARSGILFCFNKISTMHNFALVAFTGLYWACYLDRGRPNLNGDI